MFKKIGGFFEKRKNVFNSSQDKTKEIKHILQAFLKNRFGDDLVGFSIKINYDYKNNDLTMSWKKSAIKGK